MTSAPAARTTRTSTAVACVLGLLGSLLVAVTIGVTPATALGGNRAAQISSGLAHTCVLLETGGVRCWGDNAQGQLGDGTTTATAYPVDVALPSLATKIAAGGNTSCALLVDATVVCWGGNSTGELGASTGSAIYSASPLAVESLTGATDISVGNDFACAIVTNGHVRCWGSNVAGQLGLSPSGTIDNRATTDIVGLSGVTTVAAGGFHACARLGDASIRCWGRNVEGELGDGTTASTAGALVVPLVSDITELSAGLYSTCARQNDGLVKCWGINAGTGVDAMETVPHEIYAAGTGVKKLAPGPTGCVTKANGTVECWGSNWHGELGTTPNYGRATSGAIPGIADAREVSVGTHFVCALQTAGTVQCWGFNNLNQLGNGTTGDALVATEIVGLSGTAVQVSTGWEHTCAVTRESLDPATWTAACWGLNTAGQVGSTGHIGDGTTDYPAYVTKPQVVTISDGVGGRTPLTGVVGITSGSSFTCALMINSHVRCWGADYNGEQGNGSGLTDVITEPTEVAGITTATQIEAGFSHVCALLSNSTITCWGANYVGQLGDSSTTSRDVPTLVTGIANASSLGAGYSGTCAALSDNTSKCWGQNTDGQVGNGLTSATTSTPALVTNPGSMPDFTPSSVEYGGHFSCARTTTSAVRCWGANDQNWLGVSPVTPGNGVLQDTLPNSVGTLSVGSTHSCGILNVSGSTSAVCWGENTHGQLGYGDTSPHPTAVAVANLTGVASISAGDSYSCATRDSGAPVCWGDNQYGQLGDATIAHSLVPTVVQSIGLPGIPLNVRAVAGNNRVTLSWAPDGVGGNPSTYRISAPYVTERTTHSTAITITGLTNGRRYTFTVVAENKAGMAVAIPVSSTPRTVPSKVRTLGATFPAAHKATITVKRVPTTNGGSRITRYEYCRTACTVARNWKSFGTTSGTPKLKVTLTGFTRGRYYTVKVRARNAAGVGSYVSLRFRQGR